MGKLGRYKYKSQQNKGVFHHNVSYSSEVSLSLCQNQVEFINFQSRKHLRGPLPVYNIFKQIGKKIRKCIANDCTSSSR